MDDISLKIDKILSSKFENHLKSNGISYSHIARKIDLSPSYIRRMCKGTYPVSEKSRQKMNELLQTNY